MTHTTKYEKKDGKTQKVKSGKSGTLEKNPGANNPSKKEGDK
jgi:hypothetical protein